MLIDLTSVAERSEAGVEGKNVTVGWAVAVSIRLLRDEFVTVDAGLGVATGGCCFFFNASCKRSTFVVKVLKKKSSKSNVPYNRLSKVHRLQGFRRIRNRICTRSAFDSIRAPWSKFLFIEHYCTSPREINMQSSGHSVRNDRIWTDLSETTDTQLI